MCAHDCKLCRSQQYHVVFQAGLEEKVFRVCRYSIETGHPEGCECPPLQVCKATCGWPEPWLTLSSASDSPTLRKKSEQSPLASFLDYFCVSLQSIRQPCICHTVHGCVPCITTAERVTSVFGTIAGIVTRCPLELKLKRIPATQAWKGKMCYRNTSLELQNASEVEKAIREGELQCIPSDLACSVSSESFLHFSSAEKQSPD